MDHDFETILVVDDEPGMRETLSDILDSAGFSVVTTGTAAAAAQAADERGFGAAIIDHRLPDATGMNLAATLKQRNPDLPILLLTGYASLETAVAAVGHLDEYLIKPVPPEQLLRALRSAVMRHRLTVENRDLLSQLKEANRSLRRSVEQRQHELSGLISVAEGVASSPRLDRVLDAAVDAVGKAVGTSTSAIYLRDRRDQESMVLRAVREAGWMPPSAMPVPGSPVASVSSDGHDCVLVLLGTAGLVSGALLLEGPRYNGDTFLRALAAQVAVGIENAQRFELERATVERMTELNRMKSNFLANVSHELRTPLTAVIGFARTLQTRGGSLGPDDQRMLLERIELQANRLHRLVEDLLDATRLDGGTLRVGNAPVHAAEVIDRVVAGLHDPVHRIVTDLSPDLPLVLADAGRLEQVLANLVENATKYSPVGSQVTIGAKVTSRGLEMWVTDRGIGIEPSFVPQLFEPFTQADAGSTRRDHGVGLGLAIARGLVDAMGGSIEVTSRVGAGSTFTVVLPRILPRPTRADGDMTTDHGASALR